MSEMNPIKQIEQLGFIEVKAEIGYNVFRSWKAHYYIKGEWKLYFEELKTSVNGAINVSDGLTILKKGNHCYLEGCFRLNNNKLTELVN